jgi:plasmid stability protein
MSRHLDDPMSRRLSVLQRDHSETAEALLRWTLRAQVRSAKGEAPARAGGES